jgi:hypothetical protein
VRARARQRENIGRAAAASEWTVAMVYGPRAKTLCSDAACHV